MVEYIWGEKRLIKKKKQSSMVVAFVWNCLAWPRNMMWIVSTTDSGVRCLTAAMFWLRAPPAMLMKVIEDCAAVMDVILSPVPMETTVTMMPDSEEYQFTLGYLLAWQLLLRLFHSAGSKVQVCVSLVSHLWKVRIEWGEVRTKECPVGSEAEIGWWVDA